MCTHAYTHIHTLHTHTHKYTHTHTHTDTHTCTHAHTHTHTHTMCICVLLFSPTLGEEELQKSKHIVESTKVLLREGKSDDSTDEEVLYEQTQF